jgi:hypothetical protein
VGSRATRAVIEECPIDQEWSSLSCRDKPPGSAVWIGRQFQPASHGLVAWAWRPQVVFTVAQVKASRGRGP